MKKNRQKGDFGEKIACDFLEKKGFKVIETNYQKKSGEIDIIAERKNIIHFIEVKTRSESSIPKYGLPEDAVGRVKQKKIVRTAQFYLFEKKYADDISWQIDIISIIIDWKDKKAKICFLENAVESA